MPDNQGRLDDDELSGIRGGTGKSYLAPDELAQFIGHTDPPPMPVERLVELVILDRYDALMGEVQQQVKKVGSYNGHIQSIGRFEAYFNTDAPADFTKFREVLGEDLFNDVFKSTLKDGNLTDGRTLTSAERHQIGATVDSLKTSLANMQSVEYTKLQDQYQKMNQAMDLASTTLKKFNDLNASVIRKM